MINHHDLSDGWRLDEDTDEGTCVIGYVGDLGAPPTPLLRLHRMLQQWSYDECGAVEPPDLLVPNPSRLHADTVVEILAPYRVDDASTAHLSGDVLIQGDDRWVGSVAFGTLAMPDPMNRFAVFQHERWECSYAPLGDLESLHVTAEDAQAHVEAHWSDPEWKSSPVDMYFGIVDMWALKEVASTWWDEDEGGLLPWVIEEG